MTFVPLSQRQENISETCAKCKNNVDGKCKYPILLDMDKRTGIYHTARLISFSEDGKVCQLYKEEEE